MVKLLSSTVLVNLIVSGGLLATPLCSAQHEDTPSIEMQEQARRRAAMQDAMQQVQEARLAYSAKRYTDAVEHYRNALSVLPKAPGSQKLETFINESLADALIARAIDYRSVGRIEEALQFLQEAVKLDPANQRAKIELTHTADPVRTNPALTPQHVANVEEVSRLLNLGYSLIDLGDYDKAIETFQAVRQYDAYNEAAQRGIEQAHKLRSKYFAAAKDATRARMIAEVDKTWDDAHNVDAAEPVNIVRAESGGSAAPEPNADELAYAQALEKMHIPAIAIEDADINEVLEVLQNYVLRFEAQGIKTPRHMNILGGFGSAETPGYNELMQRRASFRLNNVSMRDLLDEIAQRYGLEYYFVPYGVEFSYAGQDYGRLVDRVFVVPPHFFDDVMGSSDEDDEDDVSSGIRVKRVDPVQVLKKMNITFPKGATATYNPSGRRLYVRNTMRNLEEIETLVSAPAQDQKLIVLNVIAVETSEENIEDLGFDWLFNVHLGGEMYGSGGLDQAASTVSGMPLLTSANHVGNDMSPVATQGLRSIRQIDGGDKMSRLIEQGSAVNYASVGNAAGASPSIFGVRGVWNAADVTMIMRGLSQKKGVDMLQNPRIVLVPGMEEEVSFINVRELIYPENYDPAEIYTGGGGNGMSTNVYGSIAGVLGGLADLATDLFGDGLSGDSGNTESGSSKSLTLAMAAPAHPVDFVRFGQNEEGSWEGIGTIMRVHKAEIMPDGESVQLALTTVINDFEGFIDWGTPIFSALWTSSEIKRIELTQNHIFQPIFKRYTSNTLITVANGAVIVMGGMKEARVVRYEDKVPVLGDLPLVGRLFRSSGEQRMRRAMLIFAKVNIVDPSGADPKTGRTGIPAESPM